MKLKLPGDRSSTGPSRGQELLSSQWPSPVRPGLLRSSYSRILAQKPLEDMAGSCVHHTKSQNSRILWALNPVPDWT